QQAMRERIVRIEIDGQPEGGLGRRPFPVKPEPHETQRSLRFGESRISLDRVRNCFSCRRRHLKRRSVSIDWTRGVGVGKPGPGERILWVELCGAGKEFPSSPSGGGRELVPEIASAKVEIVGL